MMRNHQHSRRHQQQPQGRSSLLAHLPQALVLAAIFSIVLYAGWAYKTLSIRSGHGGPVQAAAPSVRLLKSEQVPIPPHAPPLPSHEPQGPPLRPPLARVSPSPAPRPPNRPPPSPSRSLYPVPFPPPPLAPPSFLHPPPRPQPGSGGQGQQHSHTLVGSTAEGSAAVTGSKNTPVGGTTAHTLPGDEPYVDDDLPSFDAYASDDPGDALQANIAVKTAALGSTVSGRMGRSSGAQLTRPSPGGTLFSWGLKEWRLGRLQGDESLPEPALRHLTFISAAASRHSAVVTADGVVWTMGQNDSRGGGGHGSPPLDASGQLGRGGGHEPGAVEGPLRGKFVVQVVTGRYHTMAVTADGELYSWGLNDWGQLGRQAVGAASESDPSPCTAGASCHSGIPVLVSMPGGVRVVGAAAGRYVSMAVDESGRLYTWGHDGCSNGGKLPERNEAYKPRLVSGELASKRVVAFDAGYVFWLAATAEGEVYTCNSQDDGYAGTLPEKHDPNKAGELGRDGDPFVPGRVAGALSGQKVEAVAAGREHAVVSTADGKVFTWGGRSILVGREGNTKEPAQALGELAKDNIRYVSAGEYHSGAASETTLYGWGSNDYLCTGVGKHNKVQKLEGDSDRGDVLLPAKALGPISEGGWQVQALVAGYQHALAIAANKGGSWETTKPRALNEGQGAATAAASTSTASTQTASTGATEPQYTDTSAPDYHTRYLAPQLHPIELNASEYAKRYRRSDRFHLIEPESPDIWKVLPPAYDPRFKNPCWMDGQRLRCIPYFHILGVSKCGTTDLYHRLSKHPELFESRNKGPHWWDECPYPSKGACTAPPNGDFDGYVDLFTDAAEKILKLPTGITGEASSNTFTSAAGVYLRGPSMDRNTTVTMPELMREASPFLRNIVIFRNPVDRYYSAFYYYRWWLKDEPTPTPEDFHKTAVREIAEWQSCVAQNGQKWCVRHYIPQQLIKGMYSEFIMDWLANWPRDQLLFLRNEDYSKTPREHMEAVLKFLGMRQPTDAEWKTIMGMETRNKNSDKYQKMLPETRAMLEDFYQPFNELLAEILGDNRYLWRDPPKTSA